MNVAVGLNYGSKFQAHTKFTKLNSDGGDAACAGLHHGEGEFSSGEEAGFFAIDGDEIGLGENLQQVLRLERFDYGAEMNLRVKEKLVEDIRYGRGIGKWTERSGIADGTLAGDSAELAGGGAADGVAGACREQIETDLG